MWNGWHLQNCSFLCGSTNSKTSDVIDFYSKLCCAVSCVFARVSNLRWNMTTTQQDLLCWVPFDCQFVSSVNCCAVLPNIRFVIYWVLSSVLHQVVYKFSFYLTFALRISLVLGSVDGISNNGNKFFRITLWSIVSICWWHAAVSGELAAALLLRHLIFWISEIYLSVILRWLKYLEGGVWISQYFMGKFFLQTMSIMWWFIRPYTCIILHDSLNQLKSHMILK